MYSGFLSLAIGHWNCSPWAVGELLNNSVIPLRASFFLVEGLKGLSAFFEPEHQHSWSSPETCAIQFYGQAQQKASAAITSYRVKVTVDFGLVMRPITVVASNSISRFWTV